MAEQDDAFYEWLEFCEFKRRYGAEEKINVFYLDHCPAAAAKAHCDRHVVKMILETAQLLSTAWGVLNPELVDTDAFGLDRLWPYLLQGDNPGYTRHLGHQRIYNVTHANHPVVLWARASTGNYDWLWCLGIYLSEEYTYRYKKVHASLQVLYTLEGPPPACPPGPQTQPTPAMPEALCVLTKEDAYDTPASYRRYYVETKQRLLKWTKRGAPPWVRFVNGKWSLI